VDEDFTADELAALAAHGLAVWGDRVIYDAQPPATAESVAEIEALCTGPLPDELRELWATAFGGEVDYDVSVRFGEHVAGLSFRELFYPGASTYRDLPGWIEHELDTGEVDRLDFLPIGGFEYLDRVYVQVARGEHHGSVVVWMQGLPPAWRLRLHEDSAARVAPDLRSFFTMLALDEDPFADSDDLRSGTEMAAALLPLEAAGPAGVSAARKLRALISAAVVDWRSAVDDGTVAGDERLRRLAWLAAAGEDDAALLARLLELECDPEERVFGGGTVLDQALARGGLAVARLLLDRGVGVSDALRSAGSGLPLALARELLAKGAEVDEQSVVSAAYAGQRELAWLLADAWTERFPDGAPGLARRCRESAERERANADRIDAGDLLSNRSADDCRTRADLLAEIADALDGESA